MFLKILLIIFLSFLSVKKCEENNIYHLKQSIMPSSPPPRINRYITTQIDRKIIKPQNNHQSIINKNLNNTIKLKSVPDAEINYNNKKSLIHFNTEEFKSNIPKYIRRAKNAFPTFILFVKSAIDYYDWLTPELVFGGCSMNYARNRYPRFFAAIQYDLVMDYINNLYTDAKKYVYRTVKDIQADLLNKRQQISSQLSNMQPDNNNNNKDNNNNNNNNLMMNVQQQQQQPTSLNPYLPINFMGNNQQSLPIYPPYFYNNPNNPYNNNNYYYYVGANRQQRGFLNNHLQNANNNNNNNNNNNHRLLKEFNLISTFLTIIDTLLNFRIDLKPINKSNNKRLLTNEYSKSINKSSSQNISHNEDNYNQNKRHQKRQIKSNDHDDKSKIDDQKNGINRNKKILTNNNENKVLFFGPRQLLPDNNYFNKLQSLWKPSQLPLPSSPSPPPVIPPFLSPFLSPVQQSQNMSPNNFIPSPSLPINVNENIKNGLNFVNNTINTIKRRHSHEIVEEDTLFNFQDWFFQILGFDVTTIESWSMMRCSYSYSLGFMWRVFDDFIRRL